MVLINDETHDWNLRIWKSFGTIKIVRRNLKKERDMESRDRRIGIEILRRHSSIFEIIGIKIFFVYSQ